MFEGSDGQEASGSAARADGTGVDHATSFHDASFAEVVLARQPLASFVFDMDGIVRWSSAQAAADLGLDVDEFVGMNVIDTVHPDDARHTADMLEFSRTSNQRTMGPIALRYVDHDGVAHQNSVWVEVLADDPEIRGCICTVQPETVDDHLTDAVTAIASERDRRSALLQIATGMSGSPLFGAGAVLVGDEMVADASPELPTGLVPCLDDGGPWTQTLHVGLPEVAPTRAQLPEPWRATAVEAGFAALWCWPVPARRSSPDAAVVVWRRTEDPPSPNQKVDLDHAAAVTRLAIESERQRRQLEEAAFLDQLTGLANRTFLFRHGEEVDITGSAVVYVDLDGFKAVNDRFGHAAGDDVLAAVADRLRASVRATDFVARVGGDEFVVVCPSPCSVSDSEHVATRMLTALQEPIETAGRRISIGASIGIAHHDDHPDLEALMQAADRSLYRAKQAGRGCWQLAGGDPGASQPVTEPA